MSNAVMHNTCSAVDDGQTSDASRSGCSKGFMLFGVRLMEGSSFRKSASMNNLAQLYDQPQDSSNNDVGAGYASDDVVHPSARSRERKRGVPWSEEEHKLFLLGLQKVGKGDWRGISRNFVKTRTPTQVASHAQKYFLRRNNHNRRRRRSSLFDITTDVVLGSVIMHQDNLPQPAKELKNLEKFPVTITPLVVPVPSQKSIESFSMGQVNQLTNSPKPIRSIPILPLPPSTKMANLDLNKTSYKTTTSNTIIEPPSLSLNLSISPSSLQPPSASPSGQQSQPARNASTFQDNFNGGGGDNIISVA